ncbi:MAG: hypothetical protein HQ549_06750 [Candidatus Omnitrophica bacterium]|nr:hypothetical protein [Candidatus Omnitrophota bacterium]
MTKIMEENPIVIYVGLIVTGIILLVAGISLVFKALFKGKSRYPVLSDPPKDAIKSEATLILSEDKKSENRPGENESTMDNLRKKPEIITKENTALWEDETESAKAELSDIKNRLVGHRKISQDIKLQIAEITEGIPRLQEAAGDIAENAESK